MEIEEKQSQEEIRVEDDQRLAEKRETAESHVEDAPTVAEKLAELLNEMGAQREQMVKIVECCSEERTAEEIDAALAPLREYRRSVYSPITMRSLLLKAGALEYHDNDEQPEEQTDAEGNLVLPQTTQATWIATTEALECCKSLDPFADLACALDGIANRKTYMDVLDFCAAAPRSVSDVSARLTEACPEDATPLDAGGVVGKLEEIGALEWRGAWTITPLGNDYLGLNS